MGNQVRYIDLGLVPKEVYTGVWEYQNVVDVQEPTIISFSLEKKIPVFFGVYPDDITHILDELDEKVRIFDAINSPPAKDENGKLLIDQELGIPTTAFYLEGPKITNIMLLTKREQDHVWPLFQDAISEEATKFNIQTKWNSRNDGLFLSDGYWKKFVGGGKVDVFDWTETNMTISYDLDIDMANKIRELDYKKTLKAVVLDKKDFFGDMGLIMGGLFDENPSIVQNKFTSDVIDNISSKINYEIKKDNLTNEELNNVINRGNIMLLDKEWMYNGRDMHYKA